MLVVGEGAVQVMMSASGTLAEVTCMPSVDLALAEAERPGATVPDVGPTPAPGASR